MPSKIKHRGKTYQVHGQYVDDQGNVCFLDRISDEGVFYVRDLSVDWCADSIHTSEYTSGTIEE